MSGTRSIRVDPEMCQGHGRCYAVAPELLAPVDDEGHAEFVGAPVDADDASAVAAGERAIRSCPEQALSWVDGMVAAAPESTRGEQPR